MRAIIASAVFVLAAGAAQAAESPLAGTGVSELLDLFTTLAGAAGLGFVAIPVPEPTSMALLAAGAAGLAAVRRRRK